MAEEIELQGKINETLSTFIEFGFTFELLILSQKGRKEYSCQPILKMRSFGAEKTTSIIYKKCSVTCIGDTLLCNDIDNIKRLFGIFFQNL